MTRADLSPVMQRAYDALSEEDRDAFMYQLMKAQAQNRLGAIMRIMMRNLSHNAGKHAVKTLA